MAQRNAGLISYIWLGHSVLCAGGCGGQAAVPLLSAGGGRAGPGPAGTRHPPPRHHAGQAAAAPAEPGVEHCAGSCGAPAKATKKSSTRGTDQLKFEKQSSRVIKEF